MFFSEILVDLFFQPKVMYAGTPNSSTESLNYLIVKSYPPQLLFGQCVQSSAINMYYFVRKRNVRLRIDIHPFSISHKLHHKVQAILLF